MPQGLLAALLEHVEEMHSHPRRVRFHARNEAEGVHCLAHSHMAAVQHPAAFCGSSLDEFSFDWTIDDVSYPVP